MKDRRSLIQGLEESPPVDPALEREIVFQGKTASWAPVVAKPVTTAASTRAPISTRIRADIAEALKRASLERQLAKIELNAINEILEITLEPWLRDNGYLS